MIINGRNIFMGVHEQMRGESGNRVLNLDDKTKLLMAERASMATAELRKTQDVAATVTLSKENRDFLTSQAGYEKMKSDIDDLYLKNFNQQKEIAEGKDKNDPFWENTGNQWLILSEQLYKNGFYENMSKDEVKEMEDTLAKITAGMDHISRIEYTTGINFSNFYESGSNYFMSSSEAVMELESSTAALQYFADKYVDSDKQDEFKQLVGQYNKHNREVLEGYSSPIETFQKTVHELHSGKYPNSAIFEDRKAGEEHANFKYTKYLGGINHTEEDKEEFRQNMRNLFEQFQLNLDNKENVWNQINKTFVDYNTNANEDTGLKTFVLDESKHTFQRIGRYWDELL